MAFAMAFGQIALLMIAVSFSDAGQRICDFEGDEGTCGFSIDTNSSVTQIWQRTSGRTDSFGTGPENDHTQGDDSGHYLYFETSSPAAPGDWGRATTASVNLNGYQCLDFWYNMYGNHCRTLNVYILEGDDSRLIWTETGNKGMMWKNAQVMVQDAQQSPWKKFRFEAIRGADYQGDIAVDDIYLNNACIQYEQSEFGSNPEYEPEPENEPESEPETEPETGAATGPHTGPVQNPDAEPEVTTSLGCDFDNMDLCGIVQDNALDKWDWLMSNNDTASANTGPSADHTTRTSGQGYFLYFEASSPAKVGDNACLHLRVPKGEDHCLEFWYHMYGAHMGTLNIKTYPAMNVLWTLSGDQGDSWRRGRVSIPDGEEGLLIEAKCGSDYDSDIGLDDVLMTSGLCAYQEPSASVPQQDVQCFLGDTRPQCENQLPFYCPLADMHCRASASSCNPTEFRCVERKRPCGPNDTDDSDCQQLPFRCLADHLKCGTRRPCWLPIIPEMPTRLVDGSRPGEGRVEVLYNDTWGTICSDGWTDREAMVICAGLGYKGPSRVIRTPRIRQGRGEIWLDGVHCHPLSPSLSHCFMNEIGIHDCTHSHDVSVSCSDSMDDWQKYYEDCAKVVRVERQKLGCGPNEHLGRCSPDMMKGVSCIHKPSPLYGSHGLEMELNSVIYGEPASEPEPEAEAEAQAIVDGSDTIDTNLPKVPVKKADCKFGGKSPDCQLTQDTEDDDFDWMVYEATPPQVDTPEDERVDTLGGDDSFFYLNFTGTQENWCAVLLSQYFDGSIPYCLAFRYYIQGPGVGRIKIFQENITTSYRDYNSRLIKTIEGDKGYEWHYDKVTLEAMPGQKVRVAMAGIVGIVDPELNSDGLPPVPGPHKRTIAFDDILLVTGRCKDAEAEAQGAS